MQLSNFYFFVTASIKEYKDYKIQFNDALAKINKVLPTYFETGTLKTIKKDDLQDIMYDLLDLEVETQGMYSYYAEWSLLWIEAIITLRQSEINLSGTINQ